MEELLVREETETSPGRRELQTVPLSEPSLAYCAESPALTCGDAEFEGASQDGSRVFFTSTQALVAGASNDTAGGDSAVGGCVATTPGLGGCNLYEYEFLPGGGHRLVLASAGSGVPQVQGVARISEDGSHVYFVAKGVLTGTPNDLGEAASEGAENLYVFERDAGFPEGRTSFIARLSSADEFDWAQADNRPVQASSEGSFLVFISHRDLTGEEGVEEGSAQVYEYDAETRRLVRASVGQGGYGNDGKTPVYGATLAVGPEAEDHTLPAPYSVRDSPAAASGTLTPDDGVVFFASPTALTPGAVNDQRAASPVGPPIPNVYEYSDGNVYLVSAGGDTSTIYGRPGVQLLGASATGSDVFFTTASQLVPWDLDNQVDVYDARVVGGFPGPSTSTGCEGEACQGLVGTAPVLPAPGSTSEAAAVGMAPAAPAPKNVTKCVKGKKLTHGRCVKSKSKIRKKATKAKRASRDRRGK